MLWTLFPLLFGFSCGSEVVPFTVNIQQEVLDDLRVRLDLARFPDSVEQGSEWHYGANLDYLKVSWNKDPHLTSGTS